MIYNTSVCDKYASTIKAYLFLFRAASNFFNAASDFFNHRLIGWLFLQLLDRSFIL